MIAGRGAVALVLSGGGGTRLWPVSTDGKSKQFLKLFSASSLFQRTLSRLATVPLDHVFVIANAGQEGELRRQIEEAGTAAPMLLLEPVRRDSAAAIAAGVLSVLADYPPDTTVIVLPSDHLIGDDDAFADALTGAVAAAGHGHLVTFGIRPTHPSTEFGYIECGPGVPVAPGAFHVSKFHEKPRAEVAKDYVASGRFLWNSGMFVFRADAFAREAERLMPDIWRAAGAAARAGVRTPGRFLLDHDAFVAARRISIDYALFEKSDRVTVIPVSFGWSDIGNWAFVHGALGKDTAGNAIVGDVVTRDVKGSLVIGDGAKVVVVGVENLVVVASPNGTFVAPLSRAAEIKGLLDQ